MIAAKNITAGRESADVCGPRMLLIQVFAQAVRDARCRNPRLQHMALNWLNDPETRRLATELGIQWGVGLAQITQRDLPTRQRDTWFAG